VQALRFAPSFLRASAVNAVKLLRLIEIEVDAIIPREAQ
jgi:hypothetical protein